MTPLTEEQEHLAVIIPCLNEEHAIGRTVQEVLTVAERLPMGVEILMIDDGSTDGTRSVMEQLCSAHPECSFLHHEKPRGVGFSVIEALGRLRPRSWVTGIPGDQEFEFDSILRFMEIRGQYDLILGYYANPVIRTAERRLASFCFMKTVSILYGFPYRYLNGMKLFRVECFQGLEVVSSGHAFNAELLAKAILRNPDLRIGEATFKARGRARGRSKAVRPGSIFKAVWEVYVGMRSVAEFRQRVIQEQAR